VRLESAKVNREGLKRAEAALEIGPGVVAAPCANPPTDLCSWWTLGCWPAVDHAVLCTVTSLVSGKMVDEAGKEADSWAIVTVGGPSTVGTTSDGRTDDPGAG